MNHADKKQAGWIDVRLVWPENQSGPEILMPYLPPLGSKIVFYAGRQWYQFTVNATPPVWNDRDCTVTVCADAPPEAIPAN